MAYHDDEDDAEVDGFLGSGGPALKFADPGDSHTITITQKPIVEQMRDFDDDEPLWWPNGKPKNQMIVFGSVDSEHLEDDDDDGDRRLFVKAGMVKALRDAMRKAKAKKLLLDGRLTMTYERDGEKTKPKHKPPKVYSAVWVPPAGGGSGSKAEEDFLDGPDEEDDQGGPLAKQVKETKARVKAGAAASRKAADDSEEPPF
jgi:hypothetical protein